MTRPAIRVLALLAVLGAPALGAAQTPGRTAGRDIGTGLIAAPGDPAPPVAGLRLGDTLAQAIAALGAPDPSPIPEDSAAPVRSLSFHHGALLTLVGTAGGVARIMLMRPDAGDVQGVRVGDSWESAADRWGEPTSASATTALYGRGPWFVAMRIDPATGRIGRIMLALVQSPTQPTDLPPPTWVKSAAP